jgi:hypothetical protein
MNMNGMLRPCLDVHIPDATKGWELLMQQGVLIPCRVGITVEELMLRELAIPDDMAQRRIDVIFLNGMPLDDLKTVVPQGSRLALAAGLPGIAGLAMKKNSEARALRPSITHTKSSAIRPEQGCVALVLFSLAIPMLAAHFLRRGVCVESGALSRFLANTGEVPCLCNGELHPSLGRRIAALQPDAILRLHIELPLP